MMMMAENNDLLDLDGGMEGSWSSTWVERLLYEKEKAAKAKYEGFGYYGEDGIDYSILSITVMTLGLIIFVEVVRHRIDHSAHGKPILTAVLEALYNELTTLGIVEFAVWIMQSYYDGYSKVRKAKFADVHFALFYTAIFNAIQTCLIAYFTTKVAKNLWVRPETLELNHYVEVREEFDRVHRKLEQYRVNGKRKSDNGNEDGASVQDAIDDDRWNMASLYHGLVDRVRHPYLKRKYNRLLVQVRFHELRVQFLQAYELPLKFKISDYLMRSQVKVLIRLVSVSVIAWLLLTAVANLLYFIMGVVAYYTGDDTFGDAMAAIVIAVLLGFILFACALSLKMKHIFWSIMHREELWDTTSSMRSEDMNDWKTKREKQLNLFWISDPKVVITAIQFMQFGYAVALSSVIIFWDTLAVGQIAPYWWVLMIAVAYAVFLYVVVHVIPRFTLCTSLGQLVDRQRLQETVASFRLQEARRVELAEKQRLIESQSDATPSAVVVGNLATPKGDSSNCSPITAATAPPSRSVSRADSSSVASHHDNTELIAELVKVDTDSLRINLPKSEQEALHRRDQLRKSRKKSASDGVSAMANLKNGKERVKDDWYVTPGKKKKQGEVGSAEGGSFTGSLTETSGDELKPEDTMTERLRERRQHRHRTKSVSDGVALMSMRTNMPPIDSIPDTVQEEEKQAEEDEDDCSPDQGIFTTIPSSFDDDDDDDDDSTSGCSDIGDIPPVGTGSRDSLHGSEHHPKKPMIVTTRETLRSYYLSKRFVLFSNIFGTMVAFFMVGQRVEGFLVNQEGFSANGFIDFAFPLTVTFWILFVWLSLFLVTSGLIFYSVGNFSSLECRHERKVMYAAALDAIISGTCLVVLCAAEAQRCCYADSISSGRLLQEEDYYTSSDNSSSGGYEYDGNTYDSSYKVIYDDPEPTSCDCPTFGSRTYGGLGTIEPYVSLIALRMLRHYMSKRLVVWFGSKSENEDDLSSVEEEITDPFEVFGDKDHQHHGNDNDHGMQDERGSVSELWQVAVAKFPEIVAEYGEFSEELLRAMLGIPILSGVTIPKLMMNDSKTNPNVLESPPHVLMDSIFTYPDAKIVRRMRRCDRKLLPICDTWMVADVVMTSKELVYLDAEGVDSTDDQIHSSTMIEAKQAITATNGGKGLPLREVTAGRKVVGQLLLSDIDSIYVERILPHKLKAVYRGSRDEDEGPAISVEKNEYWHKDDHECEPERATSWHSVTQDIVRIHTVDGYTLCLRFYSDFNDAQKDWQQAEHEETGPLHMNNALLWAQTVVRFCGPGQLKQSLPHFGDGTSDELRDVLTIDDKQHSIHVFKRQLVEI